MSEPKKSKQMLDRFADNLVEDILNASDEEILAEATEDYGSPKQEADKGRALLDKARTAVAKKRLVFAREELAKQRQGNRRKTINLEPSEARRRLHTILEQSSDTTANLTLAARKEGELSDEDVLGMLEDLDALGISSLLDVLDNEE